MADISQVRPWQPFTYFGKDELFRHIDVVYKVIEGFTSGTFFEKVDSRYTVTDFQKYITKLETNDDGDLIATFSDGSTLNVGSMGSGGGGGSNYLVTERLVVASLNSLTAPTYTVDVAKPVKLHVNHTAYHSVELPAPFTPEEDSFIWNPSAAGFDLDLGDTVVVEYSRAP